MTTIETKVAQAAVKALMHVAPSKTAIPIMGHIMAAPAEGAMEMTASDMDTTMRVTVRCDDPMPEAVCLPAGPFAEFVGKAKGGEVSIVVEGRAATISSGRNRIKLATMPAVDYPMTKPPVAPAADINPDEVAAALKFCASSVEDSDVRYHIAGVHLVPGDGVTDAWGTDGKSVHHWRLPEIVGIAAATIPQAAVAVIVSALTGADTARFGLSDRGWTLDTPGLAVWGKVIDGGYPDVNRAVSQFGEWIDVAPEVRAADLIEGISGAAIGADKDSAKARNMVVKIGVDGISLRGHKGVSGVMSAGRAFVDCATVGEFGAILNGDKIRAAASAGDMLSIQAAAESRAVRVSSPGNDRAEAVIMAMPAMASELADE